MPIVPPSKPTQNSWIDFRHTHTLREGGRSWSAKFYEASREIEMIIPSYYQKNHSSCTYEYSDAMVNSLDLNVYTTRDDYPLLFFYPDDYPLLLPKESQFLHLWVFWCNGNVCLQYNGCWLSWSAKFYEGNVCLRYNGCLLLLSAKFYEALREGEMIIPCFFWSWWLSLATKRIIGPCTCEFSYAMVNSLDVYV